MVTVADLSVMRSRFPALARTQEGRPVVYADAPGGSQVPDTVIEAVSGHYRGGISNMDGVFAASEQLEAAIAAARRAGAGFIIRGLRDATDFDYEVQMSQMNAALAPDIETIFMAADPATRMISSSLVKQIARMGGNIGAFVPPEVARQVAEAMPRQGR